MVGERIHARWSLTDVFSVVVTELARHGGDEVLAERAFLDEIARRVRRHA